MTRVNVGAGAGQTVGLRRVYPQRHGQRKRVIVDSIALPSSAIPDERIAEEGNHAYGLKNAIVGQRMEERNSICQLSGTRSGLAWR